MNRKPILTIDEGPYKGLQYSISNVEFIDEIEDGSNISFEYELISEIPDGDTEKFEKWLKPHIANFITKALEEMIEENS